MARSLFSKLELPDVKLFTPVSFVNPKSGRAGLSGRCSVETIEECKDCEWVYVTRLDCDDLYSCNVMAGIRAVTPEEKKAIVIEHGFHYAPEVKKMHMWGWHSPPFYTIIYPSEVYCDPTACALYFNAPHNKITTQMKIYHRAPGRFVSIKHALNGAVRKFHGKTPTPQEIIKFKQYFPELFNEWSTGTQFECLMGRFSEKAIKNISEA